MFYKFQLFSKESHAASNKNIHQIDISNDSGKMTASKSDLALLHIRAEQLKSILTSRSNRKNFIADPTGWTDHQVSGRRVSEGMLRHSLATLEGE